LLTLLIIFEIAKKMHVVNIFCVFHFINLQWWRGCVKNETFSRESFVNNRKMDIFKMSKINFFWESFFIFFTFFTIYYIYFKYI